MDSGRPIFSLIRLGHGCDADDRLANLGCQATHGEGLLDKTCAILQYPVWTDNIGGVGNPEMKRHLRSGCLPTR